MIRAVVVNHLDNRFLAVASSFGIREINAVEHALIREINAVEYAPIREINAVEHALIREINAIEHALIREINAVEHALIREKSTRSSTHSCAHALRNPAHQIVAGVHGFKTIVRAGERAQIAAASDRQAAGCGGGGTEYEAGF